LGSIKKGEMNMKDTILTMRINSEVKKLAVLKAASLDRTLSSYVISLIKKDLEGKNE